MFGTQSYTDVMSESGRKRGRDSEGEADGMSMGLEEHRSVSPNREMLYYVMQSAGMLTGVVEAISMPSSSNLAKVVAAVAVRIVHGPRV